MSLHVYTDKKDIPEGIEIIEDVNVEFLKAVIRGTDEENFLVKGIEQGALISGDGSAYIDRFGFKLRIDEMSSGCKAALCVVNYPYKVVNLKECGLNARDCIISHCKSGYALVRDFGVTIVPYMDEIDVQVDDYIFTTVDRLNRYLFEERPYKPDMSIGGVKYA